MRAPSTLVAILAAALLAAGCSSGGSGESNNRDSTSEDRSSRPSEGLDNLDGSSSDTDTEPQKTTSDAEKAPEDSDEPLGARDGQFDDDAVRLEITDLVRSGSTTALTFELSTDEPRAGETEASAQIAQTFDDGVGETDGGRGQDAFSLDGISLIDATNRKRYLVARDSEGDCVCDGELAGRFVEPTGPTVLSATFGAPPEDIEEVDVVIPNYGTFKNVPIS